MMKSGGPQKVTIAARVKSVTRRELERLAKRRDVRYSTYIAHILEAHVQRLIHCDLCLYDHPIHPIGDK